MHELLNWKTVVAMSRELQANMQSKATTLAFCVGLEDVVALIWIHRQSSSLDCIVHLKLVMPMTLCYHRRFWTTRVFGT